MEVGMCADNTPFPSCPRLIEVDGDLQIGQEQPAG